MSNCSNNCDDSTWTALSILVFMSLLFLILTIVMLCTHHFSSALFCFIMYMFFCIMALIIDEDNQECSYNSRILKSKNRIIASITNENLLSTISPKLIEQFDAVYIFSDENINGIQNFENITQIYSEEEPIEYIHENEKYAMHMILTDNSTSRDVKNMFDNIDRLHKQKAILIGKEGYNIDYKWQKSRQTIVNKSKKVDYVSGPYMYNMEHFNIDMFKESQQKQQFRYQNRTDVKVPENLLFSNLFYAQGGQVEQLKMKTFSNLNRHKVNEKQLLEFQHLCSQLNWPFFAEEKKHKQTIAI